MGAFLSKIGQRVRANSKKGYLLDYPGFASAFGLPLVVPQTIDATWATCPEPTGADNRQKALSLYAKSMRTPWVLEGLPSTTAFAGLGFRVRRPGEATSGHIVLGCSHIYTADGIGLNYRLSKVENPVFRQKNPHLSEEDALRVAEDIRQLFFKTPAYSL